MLTLETERLILREWRESDFEPYSKICADAEVMRYLGGKAFTRLEAWRHMAFFVGHWQLRGYGHWVIEERASGKMIGRLGFLYPEGWPAFEIGWTLARDSWGKGYATEGARRALQFAFTEMGRDHVISLIHPENRASIRVAERLGEKVEGETEVFGIPVLIYGISKERWEKQESGVRIQNTEGD
ncbi:MAG TPA: GNAT family N-acetyltransferase [Pyrinomonadaceae bacterium]|nr:GNAT family N-acetyltransferase [Pyrinomonadaceae bacterium]